MVLTKVKERVSSFHDIKILVLNVNGCITPMIGGMAILKEKLEKALGCLVYRILYAI